MSGKYNTRQIIVTPFSHGWNLTRWVFQGDTRQEVVRRGITVFGPAVVEIGVGLTQEGSPTFALIGAANTFAVTVAQDLNITPSPIVGNMILRSRQTVRKILKRNSTIHFSGVGGLNPNGSITSGTFIFANPHRKYDFIESSALLNPSRNDFKTILALNSLTLEMYFNNTIFLYCLG